MRSLLKQLISLEFVGEVHDRAGWTSFVEGEGMVKRAFAEGEGIVKGAQHRFGEDGALDAEACDALLSASPNKRARSVAGGSGAEEAVLRSGDGHGRAQSGDWGPKRVRPSLEPSCSKQGIVDCI